MTRRRPGGSRQADPAPAAPAAHGRRDPGRRRARGRRRDAAGRARQPARLARRDRGDGGAGFGAVLILLAFPGSIALLPVGALVFGLLAATLVFVVAWIGPDGGGVGRLILAGIAIAALFAAGTTGLDDRLPGPRPVGGLLPRRRARLGRLGGDARDLALLRGRLRDRRLPDPAARPARARRRRRGLARHAAAPDPARPPAPRRRCLPRPRRRSPGCSASSAWSCRTSCGWRAAPRATASSCPSRRSAARRCSWPATRSRAPAKPPLELPVGPFMVVLGVPMFLWLLRKAV